MSLTDRLERHAQALHEQSHLHTSRMRLRGELQARVNRLTADIERFEQQPRTATIDTNRAYTLWVADLAQATAELEAVELEIATATAAMTD